MTNVHIESLDESEQCMLVYIVNHIFPTTFPKIEHDFNSIKWIKHEHLIRKLIDAFPKIKPENHNIYSSLLTKLGVPHQINRHDAPAPINNETTGSNLTDSL